MESKFGGKGIILTLIASLLKSNAKQRDVPALKPELYAVLDVIEAVLAQTSSLMICFFSILVHYNFVFFTFGIFLYTTIHNIEVVSFHFNLHFF